MQHSVGKKRACGVRKIIITDGGIVYTFIHNDMSEYRTQEPYHGFFGFLGFRTFLPCARMDTL